MKLKHGDKVLIRATVINVRQGDNEVTVGFDSTTTVSVPLSAVIEPAASIVRGSEVVTGERER